MRRAPLSAAVLAVALAAQLTVVSRLSLPGGGAPDLVLLAMVALSLADSPAGGAVIGFCAGLCLDVAPPAGSLIGLYALTFCLVGYLCGRLRSVVGGSALATMAAAAAMAVTGEVLYAALGLVLREPQITAQAVREVLPPTAAYDAVAATVVTYLVMMAVRLADGVVGAAAPGAGRAGADDAGRQSLPARVRAAGSLRPGTPYAAGRALGSAGSLGGVVPGGGSGLAGGSGPAGGSGWLAGPGSGPRLRGSRSGDGWVGGSPAARRSAGTRPRAGRPPRLRPGSGQPGSAAALAPRVPGSGRGGQWGARLAGPVHLRLGVRRRHDGSIGGFRGSGGLAHRAGAHPAAGTGHAAWRRGARPGPPGSAFTRGGRGVGPQARHPGTPGSGAAARSPRFRPDRSARGGSALGSAGSPARRAVPARRVRLRFGSARRRDGVLGGSVLAAGRQRRRAGGATPRFRSQPVGGVGAVGGSASRARFRAGKRARFRFGGFFSVLSLCIRDRFGGRRGGRSAVWRVGGARADWRSGRGMSRGGMSRGGMSGAGLSARGMSGRSFRGRCMSGRGRARAWRIGGRS